MNKTYFKNVDTTRSPRNGEVDGREYHFVNKESFLGLKEAGKFIESAEFSSNYYGTSFDAVSSVRENGKCCILDIELQGVRAIKKDGAQLEARFVFIRPPTFESLRERLLGRATECEDSVIARLETAKKDLEYVEANPEIFDTIITNDNIDQSYQKLIGFIFENKV